MKTLAEEELIQTRRHPHQIPELALHEFDAHQYPVGMAASFNQVLLEVRTFKELPTVLTVLVHGQNPQRAIGYRTDTNVLSVEEQTGLPYSSTHPGITHACGHDVHMTVALGVLNYFSEHQSQDDILLFLQPVEESENGGKRAYELGLLSGKRKPDVFYGLYDNPDLPAGVIGYRMGTLFARTTEVNIDLNGKGGHAAYPQNANDTIVVAASLILQAQTVISRSINSTQSGVITLGKVDGGTIRGVIAGHTRVEGTIRELTQTMTETTDDRLKDVCEGIGRSFSMDVSLELNQGDYWLVENNSELTKRLIHYMEETPTVDFTETEPAMTGEDSGYLLTKSPGTMFWFEVEDDSQPHSATFTPNEKATKRGADAIIGFFEYWMQN